MDEENLESNIVAYQNSFPTTFQYGRNATLSATDGTEYLDFFAGAGALNFGHNHPKIKERVVEYLQDDFIVHGLDMSTSARTQFFNSLNEYILKPRNLDYKIISCGPTGTNGVETALKLARKVTGRENVVAFSGAFHGMSLGSLELTSDSSSRKAAGVSLGHVTRLPFVTELSSVEPSIEQLRGLLHDDHSGIELPAAIVLETIQAEGGIHLAPYKWLKELRKICDEFGIMMIIDDIQVGVWRTGDFFSFEEAGIVPDIVTISKSIGGMGMPLSLVFFKKELDVFNPGEHTGTFRGNQLGFVAGQAAIEYAYESNLTEQTKANEQIIQETLEKALPEIDSRIAFRGRGMVWGIDFSEIDPLLTGKVQEECFNRGLIIECAGSGDTVLKMLPPLTIETENLSSGLEIIIQAIHSVLAK